ncbi:hypothetical protein DER46DRAFT_629398 [Fusarium sp. MPI-SDFR-AT-0072]|nr:hypothetical protein DER46DRAFT_629398 [Fusarium sp. MPI-SDFR-AT-0072]
MVFRRGYMPLSEMLTTAKQQTGIAIIFLITSLAFVTWGAHMYSRFRKKEIGISEFIIIVYVLYILYYYYNFYIKDLLNLYNIKPTMYSLNVFNIILIIIIFLTMINRPVFYILSAIIIIIIDILTLLIPFWIFLGLKMRVAVKLGLIIVFLIGGIVTIVAILRVIELYKKFYIKGYNLRHLLGNTLSSMEVNLAIMAYCSLALRLLFCKMFPCLFSGISINDAGKYNTLSCYRNSSRHRTGAARVASFYLKDIHRSRTQTEIRRYLPKGSEEEIMTYNGILWTTAISRPYKHYFL